MYHFAITADHINDNEGKGITGPRSAKLTYDQIVNDPKAEPFKMFDDDDNYV